MDLKLLEDLLEGRFKSPVLEFKRIGLGRNEVYSILDTKAKKESVLKLFGPDSIREFEYDLDLYMTARQQNESALTLELEGYGNLSDGRRYIVTAKSGRALHEVIREEYEHIDIIDFICMGIDAIHSFHMSNTKEILRQKYLPTADAHSSYANRFKERFIRKFDRIGPLAGFEKEYRWARSRVIKSYSALMDEELKLYGGLFTLIMGDMHADNILIAGDLYSEDSNDRSIKLIDPLFEGGTIVDEFATLVESLLSSEKLRESYIQEQLHDFRFRFTSGNETGRFGYLMHGLDPEGFSKAFYRRLRDQYLYKFGDHIEFLTRRNMPEKFPIAQKALIDALWFAYPDHMDDERPIQAEFDRSLRSMISYSRIWPNMKPLKIGYEQSCMGLGRIGLRPDEVDENALRDIFIRHSASGYYPERDKQYIHATMHTGQLYMEIASSQDQLKVDPHAFVNL